VAEEQPALLVGAERAGPVIVHLSDVHFAGRQELGTEGARHRFYDGPDSQALLRELQDELVSGQAKVELPRERLHIVVSGDLAWMGTEEEFVQAGELLEGLTEMLGVSKDRVHLVPGNHDVNWSLGEAERSRRLDNYIRLLVNFYGDDLVARRYPFIDWPIKINDPAPEPHHLVGVAIDEENGALICGLNSCVLEDEQHNFGYVGHNQVRVLKRHLTELELPDGLVRVAVMHHHLHPFPEYVRARERADVWMDVSVVRDAGVLERELEQLGFDVVLHGHKHKAQLRETRVREVGAQKEERPPLIVCGAGSVSCTELEHAQANHYEVVDVLRVPRKRGAGFVRVVWRELALVGGAEWTTAQSWTVEG
jgi:3',5'-cyclic AMP phosphodiesterase CpdA